MGMCRKILPVAFIVPVLMASVAMAQPIEATDALGRVVELEAPAERMVVPSSPAVAFAIAVAGTVDRLAGIGSGARNSLSRNVIGQIFPQAQELPADATVAGSLSSPNVEAIAALDPDIVLQSDQIDAEIEALLNAGLPVATYGTGSEQASQQMITMIAELIGESERGETLNAWRSEVYRQVSEIGETVPETERLRILSILSLEGNNISLHGGQSNAQEAMDIVGVTNLAAHLPGTSAANIEEVVSWNPDMIIVTDAVPVASVFEHPVLSATQAVAEGRVYMIPSGANRWVSWTPEAPLFWLWLGSLSYPDLYHFDLRDEMREWSAYMYGGHRLTADQINHVLFADQHDQSTGFEHLIAHDD